MQVRWPGKAALLIGTFESCQYSLQNLNQYRRNSRFHKADEGLQRPLVRTHIALAGIHLTPSATQEGSPDHLALRLLLNAAFRVRWRAEALTCLLSDTVNCERKTTLLWAAVCEQQGLLHPILF
jgi:hypothetical protein